MNTCKGNFLPFHRLNKNYTPFSMSLYYIDLSAFCTVGTKLA